MTLIIDGYNLLHASGVFGAERGPRGFEQSRVALLDLLCDLLDDHAADTIVVFDAARAPDGLPGRLVHRGIRVWFAREYPDADTLIEELVEDDTAPAHLVVVSSDLTAELVAEGLAREVVHAVQTTRKSLDLEFTDHIDLVFETDSTELRSALERHRDSIAGETLADSLGFGAGPAGATAESIDVEGHPLTIHLLPRPRQGGHA
jgi:predicted RNA-binding protein with PIN domain